jgi:branched-chain amino acid transport system substrate-binding protein
MIIDTFAVGARNAGPNLNTDSFIKSMESTKFPADMHGGPPFTFSNTFRLGNDQSRMSQIQNGRWTVLSQYLPVPKLAK